MIFLRDQREMAAADRSEVRDQAFDVPQIGIGFTVGDPFLSGRAGANHIVEGLAVDLCDVGRSVQRLELALLEQRLPDKAGKSDKRVGHWASGTG